MQQCKIKLSVQYSQTAWLHAPIPRILYKHEWRLKFFYSSLVPNFTLNIYFTLKYTLGIHLF